VPVRVLLVEDNQSGAAAVQWALIEEGFEVDIVHRGREVVGSISHSRPDAVVLDVSLPDIDGIAVAEQIRLNWPLLPIIFATGHHSGALVQAALSVPRTSILFKPYSIAALASTLKEMTRR
jgi:DNA-binding response OmpR family regulator